jgi:hypothetical protein
VVTYRAVQKAEAMLASRRRADAVMPPKGR